MINKLLAQSSSKSINKLPSIGGEPHLAQFLQVFPGVVFTGDQGGRLYMSFNRSFYDTDTLSRSETYTIERKDGENYWVVVQSFGAYGAERYNVELNTLYNNVLTEF